jgi:hypothetical protein
MEVELIECDYRNLKQQLIKGKAREFIKGLEFKDRRLRIADIDHFRRGNQFIQ